MAFLIAASAIIFSAGCSQKPSAEETAAQNQVLVAQAVEEAKKQLIAEQEKQAEEQRNQAAAVAAAKKELVAEQRVVATKAKAKLKAMSAESNPPPVERVVCTTCGVVVSVNSVDIEGKGSGLGVVAGGVVGGLLGNQVGGGTGRDLATIAGVVGGAIAGNKIEKKSKKTMEYDIVVKLDTGAELVIHQAAVPNVVAGDNVRIENDVVVKN
jgi:outer membrane lipoprotein SlyB